MTVLNRPVSRRVPDVPHRGDLMVTLTRTGIEFRYPKHRTRYLLPYGIAMLRAELLAAEQVRAQRRGRRKSKGGR